MTPFEIILLGLALSIDAFVVSFAYGLTFNQNRIKNCLLYQDVQVSEKAQF